jgi:hypothetical protein
VAHQADAQRERELELQLQEEQQQRMDLIKRALAGAVVAVAAELTHMRRLLFVYEGVRHTLKWAFESETTPGAPRPDTKLPATRNAVEEVIDELIERGHAAAKYARPIYERARKKLRIPIVGAVATAGATLLMISAVGLAPAALGAGTAYIVHRRARMKQVEAASQARLHLVAAP